MGDFSSRCKSVENEIAEFVHIGNADVKQEVVGASDVVEVDDFWHREGGCMELVHALAGMWEKPHRDDCVQPTPENGVIDLGVKTLDDASSSESAETLKASRRSDADLLGKCLVRRPRVHLKKRN